MISAFARAAKVFGDEDFISVASKCAEFIQEHMYRKADGILLRSSYRSTDK